MALMLSREQIRSVVSMAECIGAVEDAFKEFANGTAEMPTRVSLPIIDKHGWQGVMPAYLRAAGSLATKIVTVYPQNPTLHQLPSVLATIVLNNPETGRVEAILDGSYVTALRTGAVSGVATKYLARPDAQTVGIFGAGVQARKQLEAVREVRRIRRALVYDSDMKRAADYVTELSTQKDLTAAIANTPTEAVLGASIIITATTSTTPLFNGRNIESGTHINAIGAFTPNARELDNETISNSKVIVDSIQAALTEAGDIIIPLKEGIIEREDIWAELGEIVTHKKEGRTTDSERTLFKSVGLGIQDAAVAKLVFEKAKRLAVGTQFDFDSK